MSSHSGGATAGVTAPKTTGFFATELEMDFVRLVTAGERIGRRGRRLLACVPKETSVGRGAFLTFESEMVTGTGEVVARMRSVAFAYLPRPVGGWNGDAA